MAQGADPGRIQHARQQYEAVVVQGLQAAGGQGCQEFAGGHGLPPDAADNLKSCWHCIGDLARATGRPACLRHSVQQTRQIDLSAHRNAAFYVLSTNRPGP
ncbi:hypothetical protein D9M71_781900 [compost metagenome]